MPRGLGERLAWCGGGATDPEPVYQLSMMKRQGEATWVDIARIRAGANKAAALDASILAKSISRIRETHNRLAATNV